MEKPGYLVARDLMSPNLTDSTILLDKSGVFYAVDPNAPHDCFGAEIQGDKFLFVGLSTPDGGSYVLKILIDKTW